MTLYKSHPKLSQLLARLPNQSKLPPYIFLSNPAWTKLRRSTPYTQIGIYLIYVPLVKNLTALDKCEKLESH